ncbi:helix-turn-helix domain-containing protein [Desertihabitans aurantiacus]|uniref:helix-turn-helix domain-containing protein n=1 Tax=Desertihabitans aurantiacus TaxID=2282477 RepID=UPI0018E4FA0C|nr:helix-turn-helix transcriptional regulator [Desertihabitans aurantiacus]
MADTVTVTQDAEIGQRLKRLRRERQLSQAELGGEKFTGSYVSHVEKGRRRLSPEMLEYFAERLGVAVDALTGDGGPTAAVGDADKVVAFQEVQRAMAAHEFSRAARAAEQAAEDARARGDAADAWSLTLLRARALFEDGDYHHASEVASRLADEPLSQYLPYLPVEALLVAARSARAGGDLSAALERAQRATQLLDRLPSTDLRAETLAVLIGALMEVDELEQARTVADQLAGVVDDVRSDQVRGLALWIVGNMDFLTGRVEDGLRRHAQAAELLHPQADLRLWGRFRKASAVVRLQNRMTEGVGALLAQAGDALRIVGNSSDLVELRLAEARLWLLEGDTVRARSTVEFCLADEGLAAQPHSRAEAEALLADVEAADGRPAQAAAAYLRAALRYEEAGAYRRSVDMWRRRAEIAETEAAS